MLRVRLELTEPEDYEDRDAFIARLRRTVKWLNEHRSEDATTLCTNQKVRATDVENLVGAKTKW